MEEHGSLGDSIIGRASLLSELAASHVEVILREYGLGFGAFDLLAAASAAAERASQADLARRLGIAPPSLSEMVQTLSRKGLIEQVSSSEDRRTKQIALTARGKEVFSKCLEAVAESDRVATQGIEAQELEIAVRVLQTAIRNLMRRPL